MKRIAAIVGLCLFAVQSIAQQTVNATAMVGGVQRSYILYIPANYNSNTPAPLVFNFHGYTGTAAGQKSRAAFEPIADTAGFIVASPQGDKLNNINHWNVGGWTAASTTDDIGFTKAMIDSISTNYNINAKRIYSTGFSNGGFFSYELACQLSSKIAAIASVSGSFTDKIQNNCNAQHPTPILQIHGTVDAVIGYNGSQLAGSKPIEDVLQYWVTYNKCNTTPTTTAIPNTNTSDNSTVEHIVYPNGTDGVTVEFLKIDNGGHDWPGNAGNMDISASLEIWKFFSKYEISPLSVQSTNNTGIDQPTLYPNPTTSHTTLSFHAPKAGSTTLTITDMMGRTVWSKEANYLAGKNSIQIATQDFSKGIYLLAMQQATLKLVVQ